MVSKNIDASDLFTISDGITRAHNKRIFKKRLMKGFDLSLEIVLLTESDSRLERPPNISSKCQDSR